MRSSRTAAPALPLAAALVAAASATAAAHPYWPPPPPPPLRWQLELGPRFSAMFVGGYSGLVWGTRLAVGLVRDRLAYLVEGEVGDVGLDHRGRTELAVPIRGYAARTGASVRWTWGRGYLGDKVSLDGWLQGGAGVHAVWWRDGGRLARPDALVGLGISETIGERHRYSLDVGLVFVIGRGDSAGPARCAGPCDQPTPAVHGDVEMIDQVAFTARW